MGLDREAAKQAFSRYLDDKTFTADQIRFVDHIINHLTIRGIMDAELLYEQPYTDIHEAGLDGVFPDEADNLLGILGRLNQVVLEMGQVS